MNNVKLIKELNDSLKPKDPVAEALKSLGEMGMPMPTELEDDQVEMLADYMKEMIEAARKRGTDMSVEDAAGMALEDVAGFETAPKRVLSATIQRLAQAYTQKFGA